MFILMLSLEVNLIRNLGNVSLLVMVTPSLVIVFGMTKIDISLVALNGSTVNSS